MSTSSEFDSPTAMRIDCGKLRLFDTMKLQTYLSSGDYPFTCSHEIDDEELEKQLKERQSIVAHFDPHVVLLATSVGSALATKALDAIFDILKDRIKEWLKSSNLQKTFEVATILGPDGRPVVMIRKSEPPQK